MSRVNPRTVVLRTMQEGCLNWSGYYNAVVDSIGAGRLSEGRALTHRWMHRLGIWAKIRRAERLIREEKARQAAEQRKRLAAEMEAARQRRAEWIPYAQQQGDDNTPKPNRAARRAAAKAAGQLPSPTNPPEQP